MGKRSKHRRRQQLAMKTAQVKNPAPWMAATAETEQWTIPQDGGMWRRQAELYQRLSWVHIAISTIARAAAVIAFSVKQRQGETLKDIPNHPFELLLQEPNPLMSRFEFLEAVYSYLGLTGNAYIWLNRTSADEAPAEMWVLPSHRVRPVPDTRMYLRGYIFTNDYGVEIPLEPWEVVHLKRFHPLDSFVGLSPIEVLATVAIGDLAMQEYNTNYFGKDHGKPAGMLAFADQIDDISWQKMGEDIKRQHGGTKRNLMRLRGAGKGGVEWIATSITQKDMEFLQGRTFNKEEIFAIYAPGLASVLAVNATEANAQAGESTLQTYALYPLLVATAEKLTRDILPAYGKDLKGEFDDPRRKDRALELQEQAAFERSHTIDEVREKYYQAKPIGDDRGKLLLAEINQGPTDTRPAEDRQPAAPAPGPADHLADDDQADEFGAGKAAKHLSHNQQRHAWRFGGGGLAPDKLKKMPKPEREAYFARLGQRTARDQARGGGGGGAAAASAAGNTPAPRRNPEAAKTKAFGNDPNKVYEFRHRVVDLDELVTSNKSNGAVNPAYTQELQPRDRSRAASQNQIDQVAKNLTPEAMLLDFHQIDKGSPIIGRDMMVESGNGRTLALKRAQEAHPEKWREYQDKAREHAEKLGIDPREFDGKKNPVIVRERLGDDDRVAFAREANAPPVLQMSTLETAQVDSRRLKDSDALQLKVREDQTIDQALRSKDNEPFVQRFMATLPANERASLMRGDGTLNQAGIYRMKGALFTRAFPGDAGSKVAESFLESVDSNVKNFENSVAATLPGLSRARSLTSSGQRHADLDMSNDIATAISVYSRIKDQQRFTVDDYLGQGSMFDRETTPFQDRILKHFDKVGRSPTKIKRFMQRYIDEIENSPEPGQGSMFGDDDRPTKDQILDRILKDDD